jgi:pimeloyl-ACP methyl ester carboxylesterase
MTEAAVPSEAQPSEAQIDTLERDGAAIAYVHTPSRAPNGAPGSLPGVLFCPGFMSDMGGSKALALEAWAKERGIAFTRFDYQGHGASSGRFIDGTIGQWADDAQAVLERVCKGPTVVVGSSMGGWIALLLARRRPDLLAGLVGVAAAPDFTQELMWDLFDDAARRAIMQQGVWMRPSDYPEYDAQPITRALIEDGRKHLIMAAPHPYAGPVRLLHGQCDPDVPWELSLRVAHHIASTDVQTTFIKDGDHRLSRPEDLALLCAAVAELTLSP